MTDSVRAPALISGLRKFTLGVSVFSISLGLLVLVGWALGLTQLTVVLPGLASMKPNTAACLALCGLSLWCWCADASKKSRGKTTWAAKCFALLTVFVGLATLAEYVFHSNYGIDQLLFVDRLGDGHSLPGRMAPNTALCFVVLGLALVLIPKETKGGHRPAQYVSLFPAFISLMAILGYLYSAVSLYRIASFTGMAVHTAIAFFLLSLGVFFSAPDRGLAAVISSDSLGGILLRRLLPTASLVPIVIGWLRMEGQKAGWYGTEFGLSMMVTVDVAIFVAVIYLSATEIDRTATARHESELAMRTAQDGLLAMNYTFESVIDACPFPIITLDRQACVQVWNRAAEKVLGWSWLQIRGRAIPVAQGDRTAELGSIFESLASGDSVDGIQIVLISSDDRPVTVTVWAAPIVIGSRGFTGAVLILQNVAPVGQFPNRLERVHS
jgi:PAS domain-containing protein